MNNIEVFKQHVLEEYPKEAVGIVVEGDFLPLANIASSPFDSFLVEKGIFLTYENRIQEILHSHTYTASVDEDPRTPSKPDMILAKSTKVTQGIVHTDGVEVSDILYFNKKTPHKLLGRVYISGVYDCFTIVRDYFIFTHNYYIDILPRSSNWLHEDPMYMVENLDKQGFIQVDHHASIPPEIGDVLVFAFGTKQLSHLGVYVGRGMFIHHLNNRPSCTDKLSKYTKQHAASYRLINE